MVRSGFPHEKGSKKLEAGVCVVSRASPALAPDQTNLQITAGPHPPRDVMAATGAGGQSGVSVALQAHCSVTKPDPAAGRG